MALSANFGPFHMKSSRIFYGLIWLVLGLTLGNLLGVLPDNPTLQHLISIPFWSWAIMWPLCVAAMFPAKSLVILLIVVLALVFGRLFVRWNWPHEGNTGERIT